ncbi:hypothetical protein GCM10022260_10030 [Gaetbulibacter aestuarii]
MLQGLIGFSQNDFITWSQSQFGVEHKASPRYSIDFSLRSRYVVYDENGLQFRQLLLELTHFSSFKINNNQTASLGINLRNRSWFDPGSNEIRLTEAYEIKSKKSVWRHSHRFRIEQRFYEGFTNFRERYQYAVDFPLKGPTLEVGEPFLYGAVEGLLTLNKDRAPRFNERTTVVIGWKLTKKLTIFAGPTLDYQIRTRHYDQQNVLFILTAAVLKI